MTGPLDILDDGNPNYPTQRNEPETKAPAKKKRKVQKRKAAPKVAEAKQPKQDNGEFAGISSTECPAACKAERCVISTVGICKHPFKTGDGGCGPITLANRERARKLIKHQIIDLRG